MLPELMNKVCFDSKYIVDLDANFISKFNREKNEYDYFVQRMCGLALSNEENPFLGELWIPYINEGKEDWTEICQYNRIVSKNDLIEFKFEKYTTTLQ